MTLLEFIEKYAPSYAKDKKVRLFDVKQKMGHEVNSFIRSNKKATSFWCIFMHKWSKWEQFKVDIPGNIGEIRQRKVCLRCGKMKEEFIEFSKYK